MTDEGCGRGAEYGDLDERALRGERLTKRRFKTIPVPLGNGEEWMVPGPPLGGDDAEAFEAAMQDVDAAMAASSSVLGGVAPGEVHRMMRAWGQAAYAILRSAYPGLTREQFEGLVDSAMAQEIVLTSISGEQQTTDDDRYAETLRRVTWALEDDAAEPDVSLAVKVTTAVLDGIPEPVGCPDAEVPSGNESPPSESA